jgi:hypothetical protein
MFRSLIAAGKMLTTAVRAWRSGSPASRKHYDDRVPVAFVDFHFHGIRVDAINSGLTNFGKHDEGNQS